MHVAKGVAWPRVTDGSCWHASSEAFDVKIGLLGQFGSGNSGNDGSLEAMINFLRRVRPDAELLCICSNPAAIEKEFGINCISISAPPSTNRAFAWLNRMFHGAPHRLSNFFAAYGQARGLDLVIVPGTGILDDFQDAPSGWPYVLLRWCLGAKWAGAKLAFVSVGAGPIRHPLSRRMMKAAARRAVFRSYRDEISRSFMADIGFNVGDDRVYPDIAFSLPTPRLEVRSPGPIAVGVGVMSYHGWAKNDPESEAIYRTYLGKLTEFVAWLVNAGYMVRLLVGDADDWSAVKHLTERLAARNLGTNLSRVIAENGRTLHDLMDQMQYTDVVVATRYHNVICALKLGRPTISLSYAEKNDALLAEMGLGGFCQHVETFELEELKQQFTDLLDDRQNLQDQIHERLKIFQGRLLVQQTILLEEVIGRPVDAAVLRAASQPL
ncbi:MAG: polysaccharide pyruvyl transferase family protein [Hyphomicrobiales bacterium]|nr:polysaccharide pyruvyl transferase family protein [Hyphomicrobiales bacterium]